jgi:hypothetical protein
MSAKISDPAGQQTGSMRMQCVVKAEEWSSLNALRDTHGAGEYYIRIRDFLFP